MNTSSEICTFNFHKHNQKVVLNAHCFLYISTIIFINMQLIAYTSSSPPSVQVHIVLIKTQSRNEKSQQKPSLMERRKRCWLKMPGVNPRLFTRRRSTPGTAPSRPLGSTIGLLLRLHTNISPSLSR